MGDTATIPAPSVGEPSSNFTAASTAAPSAAPIMNDSEGGLLKMLTPPGINIYKQLELYKNYRPLIPQKYWSKLIYKKLLKHIIDAVKKEKKDRKEFREDLNAMKLSAQRKGEVNVVVGEMAMWKGQAMDEMMDEHSV